MENKETLEEVAITYAHKSFIWPLNKQGEKQSIPPGQLVPPGYAKHQKIATKHFRNGAKWQAERSYSEEDMKSFADWCRNGLLNTEYSVDRLNEHLEQWKQYNK